MSKIGDNASFGNFDIVIASYSSGELTNFSVKWSKGEGKPFALVCKKGSLAFFSTSSRSERVTRKQPIARRPILIAMGR
jgi:hypothetical protein